MQHRLTHDSGGRTYVDGPPDRSDIDPRYLIRSHYHRPDGKVGHDAFAVIRDTIREMDKVAIGRLGLTNREHIVAMEPLGKCLMGTLLRYPYEVRDPKEYFDDIQDVKVTKDMLVWPGASSIKSRVVRARQSSRTSTKMALIKLTNQKRPGKSLVRKERSRGENVVDLMEAPRQSVGAAAAKSKIAKRPAKKATAGQKEMLMPIARRKATAKGTPAKKPATGARRKSA